MTALGTLKPVQVAYHVPDPEVAAEQFARQFGWGPFHLMEHIALERSFYRGRPESFDHSSAYGQAGDVMVELITQHGDGPSALRDMYAPHETGIHHVAYFVPDLRAALDEFRGRGAAIALDARTSTGVEFAMVDQVELLGHMLEFYQPGDDLRRFYAYVRKSAEGWDGSRPLRRLRG